MWVSLRRIRAALVPNKIESSRLEGNKESSVGLKMYKLTNQEDGLMVLPCFWSERCHMRRSGWVVGNNFTLKFCEGLSMS